MIENAVTYGIGDNEQTAEGSTLGSVGGDILNGEIAALTLRDKGGGAAAVTVDSIDTAELYEGLGKL